ncbi:MAG: metallophosphoesterase family protein [bacterium]
MRIVFLSDIHSKFDQLKNLPDGDIIIIAGDVTSVGYLTEVEYFVEWFNNLNYEYKIFIAGNHDFLFEKQPFLVKEILKSKDIIYLEDSEIIINGLKFYGTPISKIFNEWAFNRNDEQRELHWSNIPDDVDILITHELPYGILDNLHDFTHMGCHLLKHQYEMQRIKPLVHVFGHNHYSYGIEQHDDTLFINASILDERYYIKNKPIVVDIDEEKNIKVIFNNEKYT